MRIDELDVLRGGRPLLVEDADPLVGVSAVEVIARLVDEVFRVLEGKRSDLERRIILECIGSEIVIDRLLSIGCRDRTIDVVRRW